MLKLIMIFSVFGVLNAFAGGTSSGGGVLSPLAMKASYTSSSSSKKQTYVGNQISGGTLIYINTLPSGELVFKTTSGIYRAYPSELTSVQLDELESSYNDQSFTETFDI